LTDTFDLLAFRGLFEASPYGMLIVDDDGNIAVARIVAEIPGHTPASLEGPLIPCLPRRGDLAFERRPWSVLPILVAAIPRKTNDE